MQQQVAIIRVAQPAFSGALAKLDHFSEWLCSDSLFGLAQPIGRPLVHLAGSVLPAASRSASSGQASPLF